MKVYRKWSISDDIKAQQAYSWKDRVIVTNRGKVIGSYCTCVFAEKYPDAEEIKDKSNIRQFIEEAANNRFGTEPLSKKAASLRSEFCTGIEYALHNIENFK